MSFFRNVFRSVEKFVRPIVRPAAQALTAIYAPAALPLMQSYLGQAPSGDVAGQEPPQGYFPSPHPKMDMQRIGHDFLLQSAGLYAPTWYRDLVTQSEIAGRQVGRGIKEANPEFFEDDEEEFDESDE